MRIGEAARSTGLTVKAIRHYEAVGLLGTLERDGTYRDFSKEDVERLNMIAHCRNLDFSVPKILELIEVVSRAKPMCPDPEEMLDFVDCRLDSVREEMARLQQLDESLERVRTYLLSRQAGEVP